MYALKLYIRKCTFSLDKRGIEKTILSTWFLEKMINGDISIKNWKKFKLSSISERIRWEKIYNFIICIYKNNKSQEYYQKVPLLTQCLSLLVSLDRK